MAAPTKAELRNAALTTPQRILAFVSEQFRGARFSGFVLVALGALTALLVLVNAVALARSLYTGADATSSLSLLPLIPLLMVAGVHWVSWRLYLHNS
jgi:hypothetical protein